MVFILPLFISWLCTSGFLFIFKEPQVSFSNTVEIRLRHFIRLCRVAERQECECWGRPGVCGGLCVRPKWVRVKGVLVTSDPCTRSQVITWGCVGIIEIQKNIFVMMILGWLPGRHTWITSCLAAAVRGSKIYSDLTARYRCGNSDSYHKKQSFERSPRDLQKQPVNHTHTHLRYCSCVSTDRSLSWKHP